MKIDWDNVLPVAGRMSSWQLERLPSRKRDLLYLAWGPAVIFIDLPRRFFRPKWVPIQLSFDGIGMKEEP